MSCNSIEVVVAHYNEDISWLDSVKDVCRVYDKYSCNVGDNVDDNDGSSSYKTHCPLENIGREADTYLKYIVRTYPYFPDVVVFTQANVNDHVRDKNAFCKFIRDTANGESTLGEDGFKGLNEMRGNNGWGTFHNFTDPLHHGLKIKEWWYDTFEHPPINNEIKCNYCGIFAVSKKNILFHSYDFYEHQHTKCVEDHIYGPYILERLWATIFDGKTVGKI
jgi:hypothetical protein